MNIRKKMFKMQYSLIINVILILIFNYLALKSSTINKGNYYLIRELFAGIVGLFLFISIMFFDYSKLKIVCRYLYFINIILLLLVFLIGDTRLGAKRWIDLGFISLQPAEISKIIILICFSNFVSEVYDGRILKFKDLIFTFIYILPTFLLIALQPDLSTSMVILLIYAVIIFIANIDIKIVWGVIISVISSLPIIYKFLLKDYQRKRIFTFLNPEDDLLGAGWNVMQSKIAIGSGGIFGKGFLNNTQSKLRFLPESHTDFIASVLFEEQGLIIGIIFLIIYFSLIVQIIYIAVKTKDLFGKYICYGIATIFLYHAFVNLGMIMGIMPVTGLPLLFISYGGTSLVISFILIGLVESIKIHREK